MLAIDEFLDVVSDLMLTAKPPQNDPIPEGPIDAMILYNRDGRIAGYAEAYRQFLRKTLKTTNGRPATIILEAFANEGKFKSILAQASSSAVGLLILITHSVPGSLCMSGPHDCLPLGTLVAHLSGASLPHVEEIRFEGCNLAAGEGLENIGPFAGMFGTPKKVTAYNRRHFFEIIYIDKGSKEGWIKNYMKRFSRYNTGDMEKYPDGYEGYWMGGDDPDAHDPTAHELAQLAEKQDVYIAAEWFRSDRKQIRPPGKGKKGYNRRNFYWYPKDTPLHSHISLPDYHTRIKLKDLPEDDRGLIKEEFTLVTVTFGP